MGSGTIFASFALSTTNRKVEDGAGGGRGERLTEELIYQHAQPLDTGNSVVKAREGQEQG